MTPILGGLYALAALVLVAVAIAMAGRQIAPSAFVMPAPRAVTPVASTTSYPHPAGAGIAHAATAFTLPDGRVTAIWFGGTREAGPDVELRQSILDGDAWSAPLVITDREGTGREQRRYVKTVGNPIVFRHPGGEYWLIYVSVSVGGWSGSALNLKRSSDGVAWGPSARLVTGPFANISTLVKGPALLRADGLVALPAYHEFVTAYPELLLIDAEGRVVDKSRMGGVGQIQPWVVAPDPRKAVALMRAFQGDVRRLWQTTSADGGASWSTPEASTISNPDAPAAAVALPAGRIAAVLNDNPKQTDKLNLVISDDGGKTWQHRTPVFDGSADGNTYRYPWLMQDNDGRLHVFVTESSRAIRHAVLGADALAASAP